MDGIDQAWETMKQQATKEAKQLQADYPDYPLLTATALPIAEQFCKSEPPKTTDDLLKRQAMLMTILMQFNTTRMSIDQQRMWNRFFGK